MIAAPAVPELSAPAVVLFAHALPWKSSSEKIATAKQCLGQLVGLEWLAQKVFQWILIENVNT